MQVCCDKVTNIQIPFRRGLFGWLRNRQIPNKQSCSLQSVSQFQEGENP